MIVTRLAIVDIEASACCRAQMMGCTDTTSWIGSMWIEKKLHCKKTPSCSNQCYVLEDEWWIFWTSGVAISLKFFNYRRLRIRILDAIWAITLVIALSIYAVWIGYKNRTISRSRSILIGSPCTASVRFGIKIGRKIRGLQLYHLTKCNRGTDHKYCRANFLYK